MSKYSHYEMCEKIFGSRYKFNERTGQTDVYSQTDMWDKLVEQHNQILELKSKNKKAYQEGFLQKQFEKDFEIMQLEHQLEEKNEEIRQLKEDLNNSEQKCLICNQDKISFAVEQINKTVEVAKQILGYEKIIDYFYQVYFKYEIDNLINQLKGEKL